MRTVLLPPIQINPFDQNLNGFDSLAKQPKFSVSSGRLRIPSVSNGISLLSILDSPICAASQQHVSCNRLKSQVADCPAIMEKLCHSVQFCPIDWGGVSFCVLGGDH